MMGAPCAGWRWSEEPVGAGHLHGEGEGHGGEPRGAMCYFSNLSLAPASRSTALEFLSPPTSRALPFMPPPGADFFRAVGIGWNKLV